MKKKLACIDNTGTKFKKINCSTFNEDGVICFVDAAVDWADGEKKKMNSCKVENC